MNATLKKGATITAVAALALAVPLTAFAAFGPDRQTYRCGTLTGVCGGADHVQFNSFTNNPDFGDERNFLKIRQVGGSYSDSVKLVPGKEYEVQAFVHNNADPNRVTDPAKFTALNTTLKVDMPSEVNGSANVLGHISATNALPVTIFDDINVTSDGLVKVSVDPATISSKGAVNGSTLGSITSGALLGYDSLNGSLPGCFNYAATVTFKVKVTAPVKPPVTPPTPPTPPTAPPVTPPAPAQPLPATGPEAGLAGLAGTGALGYAVVAYRRSKAALAEKLLNRK